LLPELKGPVPLLRIALELFLIAKRRMIRPARKAAGGAFPRRSLIQGTNNEAPWLSYASVAGIWLIDENTQSGWRMIV
jgi:hypothetical protein